MTNVFGLDLAALINSSIQAAGGLPQGTLTHYTAGVRTPGDLGAGLNPTPSNHTFNGTVERKSIRRKGQIDYIEAPVVLLLGASISPAVTPAINDMVTIGGSTYRLVELLKSDPASAVYEYAAEG